VGGGSEKEGEGQAAPVLGLVSFELQAALQRLHVFLKVVTCFARADVPAHDGNEEAHSRCVGGRPRTNISCSDFIWS
jgi:hypothetical protein